MTLTVVLTPNEEASLLVLARERGVSPDALVGIILKDVIDRSPVVSTIETKDREREMEELFEAFDRAGGEPGIREEAFHRENWYR